MIMMLDKRTDTYRIEQGARVRRGELRRVWILFGLCFANTRQERWSEPALDKSVCGWVVLFLSNQVHRR